MAKKNNVQVKINIPKRLDSDQRIMFADLAIKEIIERTSVKKIDVNSRPFKPYSESYKESFEFNQAGKSNKPNLKLTGNMLFSIELIDHGDGYVTIGYDPEDEIAGQVEGNQIGSYGAKTGNPEKARKFLGLPYRVVKILVAQVESKTISRRIEAEANLIDGILERISVRDA